MSLVAATSRHSLDSMVQTLLPELEGARRMLGTLL
jgi:hypothetical protein